MFTDIVRDMSCQGSLNTTCITMQGCQSKKITKSKTIYWDLLN